MANEIIAGCGFHHIGLRVRDYQKSIEMYRAIGLKEIVGWTSGDREIRMFDLGDGGRLELFSTGTENMPEGCWMHFAMKADDVEEAFRTAVAAGFTPITAPKIVPLDSHPEKITIQCAFVAGNDGEQIEFFKQI